ncbi:hypothetical protein [Haliangium sp.]|uniref:hypothetical protein n=1 Tax=Haliangium sp. TaxID=2663208 RepID=UPI003D145361
MSCQVSDEPWPHGDETEGGRASLLLASGWSEVAPGVWERKRGDAGTERVGFGAEGFEYALEQARLRSGVIRSDLARAGASATLVQQLRENDELIVFLEDSLERLWESEVAATSSKPDDDAQTEGSTSGSVCNGVYTFDVSFSLGFGSSSVTSQALWGEPGPLAPYQKILHSYAYAAYTDGQGLHEDKDSDLYGPFSSLCCAATQASAAAASPTPTLYGSNYLAVTEGCSAARFYEASYP